ncbi:MAG: ISAs1 family transposase [Jaaginema sp. PMC 1079.18]|nr:ISAs1 family transposase [Jaaginema sp. PMC 1080.18]MEC4851650.1 ISAs1 family transposase [Jaaginema sp. PMC 1079.18]MEC4867687.1 ISAs1 family transposase [Jaaginema sp. PMC 1078.18]
MQSPTRIEERISLWEHFQELEDPRATHLIEHQLLDILALTLCAVICGAESWVEVELYGKTKKAWLSSFLALPNGIPSHDTIARLFAALNPNALTECFSRWVRSVAQLSAGEVIAIDGKTLRRSYDRGGHRGAIHMVSAWASQNRLVLGQVKVDEKSNEIAAIPELLNLLDLSGALVTLDAMGTQTAIAEQIVEAGGDYVLSLKGNQPTLHQDVVQLFDWLRKIDFEGVPHEFHQTVNDGHGRIEIRRHWLLSSVEYLETASRWAGLKRVGMVESERRLAGRSPQIERRYYLLSLDRGVERFAEAVRSHWGIENQVHWVLDVAFGEDACRVRKDHAPENLSVVRRLALNLLRQDRSTKTGIKGKRLKAGWDNDFLLSLFHS